MMIMFPLRGKISYTLDQLYLYIIGLYTCRYLTPDQVFAQEGVVP